MTNVRREVATVSRLLRKLVSALGLLLALSPVFVVIGWLWLPGKEAHWALWPVAAVLLAVLIGLARGRLRAALGALGLAGLLAAMVAWGPGGGWPLLAAPLLLVYWQVLSTASRPPFDEWRSNVWVAGAVVHLTGFIAARGLSVPEAGPALRALSLAYVPVFLLMINRLMLAGSVSARDGSRPPRRISAGNRWLVLGVSAMAIGIVNLRALRDAFYAVGNRLLGIVGAVIDWLAGLFYTEPTTSGGGQDGGGMDMLMGEVAEPSMFWLVLEKVAIAVAILIGIALLVIAAGKLYRALRAVLARLAKHMRGMMAQLSEGVQEKTESILDWEEAREVARRGVRRVRKLLTRPPRWQDMDNRQRVRWAYGQTVRADMPPGRTARESLKGRREGERMADIYDTARYSEQPVTDTDAAFMRDALRREG